MGLDTLILQTRKEVSFDELHEINQELYFANKERNYQQQDIAYQKYVEMTGLKPLEIKSNLDRYETTISYELDEIA